MVREEQLRAFWADAKVRAKLNPVAGYLGSTSAESLPPPAWAFGGDPQTADRLLGLVLAGDKTATASAYWEYEQEARSRAAGEAGEEMTGAVLVESELDLALPQPQLLAIILDGQDAPRALIRITEVETVPFGKVSAEHARREGEGSLEQWRATHRDVFAASAPPDVRVDETMLVVLERFELLVPTRRRKPR